MKREQGVLCGPRLHDNTHRRVTLRINLLRKRNAAGIRTRRFPFTAKESEG